MIELKSPLNNAAVSLQTDYQKQFIDEEEKRAAMVADIPIYWYDPKQVGVDDCSLPLPVSFVWEEKCEDEIQNAFFYLLISETQDMKNAWVYITKNSCYDVYNLKVGTKYYWCVQKNGKRSETFCFNTLLTLPRRLKIDNVSNVRDMGGYKVEGGVIRQGLLFRGGEFESHLQLSDSGAEELRRLAIRTEIDMRGEAMGAVDFTTAEVLGIKRVFIPCAAYNDVYEKDRLNDIKKFYKVFTNPKNYPIYFHCLAGADRTGTFAFYLGAFLGMSLEDLIYDYEVTCLSIWGTRSRNHEYFKNFLEKFLTFSGNTMHEKGATFLKEYAGLTDKQLATIYNTLVENT